jgi:hypothetical protein
MERVSGLQGGNATRIGARNNWIKGVGLSLQSDRDESHALLGNISTAPQVYLRMAIFEADTDDFFIAVSPAISVEWNNAYEAMESQPVLAAHSANIAIAHSAQSRAFRIRRFYSLQFANPGSRIPQTGWQGPAITAFARTA